MHVSVVVRDGSAVRPYQTEFDDIGSPLAAAAAADLWEEMLHTDGLDTKRSVAAKKDGYILFSRLVLKTYMTDITRCTHICRDCTRAFRLIW